MHDLIKFINVCCMLGVNHDPDGTGWTDKRINSSKQNTIKSSCAEINKQEFLSLNFV